MRSIHRSILLSLIIGGCAAGLLFSAAAGYAADRFLSVIDDLPLMAELREIPDSAVVYSKPQGRIVEVAARGTVSRAAVLRFYETTLPQLGWHRGPDNAWQREEERLTLSFREAPGTTTVQFSLAPR